MDNSETIKVFTALIGKNQGIIFKVTGIYCGDPSCREDLFQDILLQLWNSFPKYDKSRKFSTWMYRIALNTAISQWRKDKKKPVTTGNLPMQLAYEEEPNENNEKIRALKLAIGKLNKAEKSIILLYLDDYPYDEISEITGITVSNIGVKINRIKKKLLKYLQESGYGL